MKPFERQALLFLLRHLMGGLAGAAVVAGGLIAFDVANLRTLLLDSPDGWLGLGLLLFGLVVTLGSVAMGVGVMSLAEDGRAARPSDTPNAPDGDGAVPSPDQDPDRRR